MLIALNDNTNFDAIKKIILGKTIKVNLLDIQLINLFMVVQIILKKTSEFISM
jgi:hypothetical protein